MAALRGLSSPTHATGTPGGICTIDRIASSPPAADSRPDSGTPMTGQIGVRGDRTGQRRGDPGSGDYHAQSAHARVLGVLGDEVGLAVRGHDPHLVHDAPLLELAGGLLHRLHVALGAHHDAHAGGVDVDVVELRLDFGLLHQLGHERDPGRARRATLLGRRRLLRRGVAAFAVAGRRPLAGGVARERATPVACVPGRDGGHVTETR